MPTTNAPANTVREPATDLRRARHSEAGLSQPLPMIIPQPGLCITFPMRHNGSWTAW
jgi:hypothetical protein